MTWAPRNLVKWHWPQTGQSRWLLWTECKNCSNFSNYQRDDESKRWKSGESSSWYSAYCLFSLQVDFFHIKSLMALPNTRAWTFNEGHVVVHSELQRCYLADFVTFIESKASCFLLSCAVLSVPSPWAKLSTGCLHLLYRYLELMYFSVRKQGRILPKWEWVALGCYCLPYFVHLEHKKWVHFLMLLEQPPKC